MNPLDTNIYRPGQLPENYQTPQQKTYDYGGALRGRLATIAGANEEANQASIQQSLARQQKQIAADNAAWSAQQSQGMQQSVGADSSWSGKDSGQDGRSADNKTVYQYKHHSDPSFVKTLSDANDELTKISKYRQPTDTRYGHWQYAQEWVLVTNRAIDAYNLAASQKRISTSGSPTVGSVVYWNTGAGKAGHAALYAGNGMVYSTDIGGRGKISLVPLGDISKKWGSQYLGWSEPYFAASPRR